MSSTTAQPDDTLSSMTRLSPSVYLHDPTNTDISSSSTNSRQEPKVSKDTITTSSSAAPKLIVLCTWMSAHPVHMSKYITGYQTHYPNSRIVIIQSSPADFFWRSASAQRRRVDPAVSAIHNYCDYAKDSETEILLHIFSNGGCHQLLRLLGTYRQRTSYAFPSHVKILDSCPGRGTFKKSISPLALSLPKSQPLYSILLGLLYLAMSVYFIITISLGLINPIEHLRQVLNDPESMKNERNRCYIYGDADKMVDWHDIAAHAEDARQKGFPRRIERFEGSGHVAHVRQGGGARYWSIVDEMWQGRQGKFH